MSRKRLSRSSRVVRSAVPAAALALGAVTLAAAPASAAGNGAVYISFPTWLGNCPAGGSVTGIAAAIGNTWSTGGDYGDDLIYGSVWLWQSNQLNARVL